MNRAFIKILGLVCGLIIFFPPAASSQNWKIFGWTMGGDCSLMYDEDHCIVEAPNIVKVPVLKTGWSNDCREKELAYLEGMGFSAGVLVNWSQTVHIYEINVKDRHYRIVSTAVYDFQGNRLAATQTASNWYCVVPGSATDKLVNTLTGAPEAKEAQQVIIRDTPVPVPQGYSEQLEQQPGLVPPSLPIPLYR